MHKHGLGHNQNLPGAEELDNLSTMNNKNSLREDEVARRRIYRAVWHTTVITFACTGKDDVKLFIAFAAADICARGIVWRCGATQ
jgi:hypothetical protein